MKKHHVQTVSTISFHGTLLSNFSIRQVTFMSPMSASCHHEYGYTALSWHLQNIHATFMALAPKNSKLSKPGEALSCQCHVVFMSLSWQPLIKWFQTVSYNFHGTFSTIKILLRCFHDIHVDKSPFQIFQNHVTVMPFVCMITWLSVYHIHVFFSSSLLYWVSEGVKPVRPKAAHERHRLKRVACT